MDWQTIESAPKDGTHVLGYMPIYNETEQLIYVITFSHGKWFEAAGEGYEYYEPTHWMPLPAIPK